MAVQIFSKKCSSQKILVKTPIRFQESFFDLRALTLPDYSLPPTFQLETDWNCHFEGESESATSVILNRNERLK